MEENVICVESLQEKKEMMKGYFKTIGDLHLLRAISRFKEGNGYGESCKCCSFATEYHPEEEGYFGETGVNFSMIPPLSKFEVNAIVDNETFYCYLKEVCVDYLKRFPKDSTIMNQYLIEIAKRLNVDC